MPQRFDASAQDEEGAVNVSGFFLAVTRVASLLDPLGAGQVAETQHRHSS